MAAFFLGQRRDLRLNRGDVGITGLHGGEQKIQIAQKLGRAKLYLRMEAADALASLQRCGRVIGSVGEGGHRSFYS
jgi:hypothetical protein